MKQREQAQITRRNNLTEEERERISIALEEAILKSRFCGEIFHLYSNSLLIRAFITSAEEEATRPWLSTYSFEKCLRRATTNEGTCGETRTKITSSLASTIFSFERVYSTTPRRKSLKKLTNRTTKIERPLGKPGSRSCPRNTIRRILWKVFHRRR